MEKREEVRQSVLGSDAVIAASGYVETVNGCVITVPRVLEVFREKRQSDLREKNAEEQRGNNRVLATERRQAAG